MPFAKRMGKLRVLSNKAISFKQIYDAESKESNVVSKKITESHPTGIDYYLIAKNACATKGYVQLFFGSGCIWIIRIERQCSLKMNTLSWRGKEARYRVLSRYNEIVQIDCLFIIRFWHQSVCHSHSNLLFSHKNTKRHLFLASGRCKIFKLIITRKVKAPKY